MQLFFVHICKSVHDSSNTHTISPFLLVGMPVCSMFTSIVAFKCLVFSPLENVECSISIATGQGDCDSIWTAEGISLGG
jgi:hypothetical protein